VISRHASNPVKQDAVLNCIEDIPNDLRQSLLCSAV